ncbi:putative pyridoxal kinase BUD17 [Kluyveromyces lactis]|uniref:pyridoxal kinase n=1 Tax=Kluyveromyces lactis (strain ATCC 8585 / CBS 2359 / DSM 70799 / NBRC 1267 / NRRL Y-1140 / WM37) TaxID=284590 RepID=Q6CU01_KLULA|nr:uncharacterized protein KLLA0_C08701g [Kluyveromyces lactis]CAH01439.1 KLLA0C08701p [Kluyveromyces lactis]|eukprot:XP_452588.1 uncharacterized protein KLLA0_C08701g [Kluyveromyces lactis]
MVSGKKVLSIQSHVVHGYVGNKAATFPLQCKGWDVDALNTVQFSNHPAYGFLSGFKSRSEDLERIIQDGLLSGLKIHYDAVLTGYLPDTQGLKKIGALLVKLCNDDPSLKWILDPVLGDNGKLYVPEDTVDIYKQILKDGSVYLATPNQFELEVLTGTVIADLNSLKNALNKFHVLYPKVRYLVVTSVNWPSSADDDSFVSACTDFTEYWYFNIPKINAHFSGSGDLFSAIIMDLLLSSETVELPLALNSALSLVDGVLRRTYDLTSKPAQSDDTPFKINDLKIIQCKDLFRSYPVPNFVAHKL